MPAPEQILAVAQMRAAEQALVDAGATVEGLMEQAGTGAAEWVWRLAAGRPVTVLCGPGNNGGDGYVIARELARRGAPVTVVAPLEPRTDAAGAARAAYSGPLAATSHGGVLVDALFGSGLTRPLEPVHAALLADLARHHGQRVAIDLPSGIDSDRGTPLTDGLPAYDLTLALGAWKYAHWLLPAAATMGARRLVPIGVAPVAGAAQVLARPHLTRPAPDAHKYTRGLVAVVGGAMPGAAALAAESAARGGAGYVRLSSPRPVPASHAIVQQRAPDFAKARAVLVGPGLGRDMGAWQLLEQALTAGVPAVVDADALWMLSDMGLGGMAGPAIVTPHEGEFAHVYGDDAGNKVERTRSAAAGTGSVIVHKGPDTVIAAPDGRAVIAPAASPWLSTAGTGDVLAGLCAARLAVGGDPFAAACEAVWLHGEAARLAGAGFVADDLVAQLPAALAACQ